MLIYLLFDKLKFSKIIYFNLRNNNFVIFFNCKIQKRGTGDKKQRKRNKNKEKATKNKEKKGNILKNKADIKKYKIKNRGL